MWLLIALFLYPYVIYPVLVYCLVRWRASTRVSTRQARVPAPQTVALVICALNEEKVIGEKLANCLALDYPREKLRIVVVSDGSSDGTADVVRRCAGIELIEQPVRRGKIANLNEVLPGLSEEIVVLSDANVMYRPDAVSKLVRQFDDPNVGCVSGKVILTGSAPSLDAPTGSYYSLEWLLQAGASSIFSMAGADGAMYALRREWFHPCPADTLIEDFVIPIAVVRQGKRVVFEPEAVGWERGPSSLREEFRRRVRIAAGAAQGLVRGNAWPGAAAPLSFWFVFVSHKLLRWLSPLVGLAILSCAGMKVMLAAVLGMTVLAMLQRHAFYFLFGQVAVGWGLLRGLAGRQTVLWAKENR